MLNLKEKNTAVKVVNQKIDETINLLKHNPKSESLSKRLVLLEAELKDLQVPKRKQERLLTRALRKHVSLRFRSLVESLQAGNWTEEDVLLFIEKEPTITNTLIFLKNKQKEEEKKDAYDAVIKRDSSLIAELVNKTEREMILLKEEYDRVKLREVFTQNDVLAKVQELDNIEERYTKTEIIYNDLLNVKAVVAPVGRPPAKKKTKKQITKEIISSEKDKITPPTPKSKEVVQKVK